ncbi:MAG: SDR family NAD(P)-dependent oxidoreductase [bacterium]
MSLVGKVALVTGASRGIGRACALVLAEQGANLLLADQLDCVDTEKQVRETGVKVSSSICDVSDEPSIENLFSHFTGQDGGLDFVVHCAGVIDDRSLLETTSTDFDRVIAVNLRGSFLVGREALRNMKNNKSGRLVMIASDLSYYGREGFSAYVASKHGVLGLVRCWAKEFAPVINVNAICPGPIDTDMLSIETIGAEWREKEKNIPLGRLGEAEDIGHMAAFLCGNGGDFITGQGLSVNGGSIMP